MNVCLITRIVSAHQPGGMQTYTEDLARALLGRGHRLTIVTTELPPGALPDPIPGVAFEYLPGTRPGSYRHGFFRTARDWVVAQHASDPWDIVHSQSYAAIGLRRCSPAPLVATLFGVSFGETQYEAVVFRALSARAKWRAVARYPRIAAGMALVWQFARYPDRLVVLSEFSRGELRRRLSGAQARRVHVVPCGIDTQRFVPGDREQVKSELGLSGPTLFAASRLDPQKGMQVAVEAMRHLDDLDVTLSIGGHGSYAQQLHQQVDRLKPGRVRLVGRLSEADLVRYYQAADVFVYPELTKPAFGLVAAEAMACGTPVVGSDWGGIPETVGDGGVLVPPGNAKALADTVRNLVTQPQRRRELGEQARRRVCERFSLGRMAQEIERVYEKAIAHRPTPGDV